MFERYLKDKTNRPVTHLTQWDTQQNYWLDIPEVIGHMTKEQIKDGTYGGYTLEMHEYSKYTVNDDRYEHGYITKDLSGCLFLGTNDVPYITFLVDSVFYEHDATISLDIFIKNATGQGKTIFHMDVPVWSKPKPIDYEEGGGEKLYGAMELNLQGVVSESIYGIAEILDEEEI